MALRSLIKLLISTPALHALTVLELVTMIEDEERRLGAGFQR